jgi:hypothetical protein
MFFPCKFDCHVDAFKVMILLQHQSKELFPNFKA